MSLYKTCCNCNKKFKDGDFVTVLIPEVELKEQRQGFRLKLSKESIETRTKKIYCSECIEIKDHYNV
jgi:hypothetical protein